MRTRQGTFLGQLKELENKLDKVQQEILFEVVDHLVEKSPDDTGAYILSHSIGRSGAVGRRLDPATRVPAPNTHREEARQRLDEQVSSIPPDTSRVFVGNNSPHASVVEDGGSNWRRPGYFVYGTLRSAFPSIIQSAKNRVGLK